MSTSTTSSARLTYVEGDATLPVGDGPKVIAHVCNDVGGWGRGFVVAVSRRWPGPEAAYRRWHKEGAGGGFELGRIQLVEVGEALWVANLVAQAGVRATASGPPLRYEALTSCLEALRTSALERGASVHMPRIGAGLAGGDWTVIEGIVRRTLVDGGVEVTVYDLPPPAGGAKG